jgi:hypothetical protein
VRKNEKRYWIGTVAKLQAIRVPKDFEVFAVCYSYRLLERLLLEIASHIDRRATWNCLLPILGIRVLNRHALI